MLQVGIRELRNNVAAVVRRAAAGERIVVTSGGTPVAMLGPITPTQGGPSLDELIAAGLVRPPRRADRPAAPEAHALPVDVRAARMLEEIR